MSSFAKPIVTFYFVIGLPFKISEMAILYPGGIISRVTILVSGSLAPELISVNAMDTLSAEFNRIAGPVVFLSLRFNMPNSPFWMVTFQV